MIKAVLFDVGGTLIAPHPSVGAVYSRVAARHGIERNPAELNIRFKESWRKRKGRRELVDKEWWRRVVDDVFERDSAGFFEELYDEFAKKEVWRIYPDVEEALGALKTRGLVLAVASNWDCRLPALLKGLNLERFFNRNFISFEMGTVKPDPRFFQRVLEELGLEPLEVLHVGDDLNEDIAGAQNAGLRAYHIDRLNKPKNSRTLSSLNELLVRI